MSVITRLSSSRNLRPSGLGGRQLADMQQFKQPDQSQNDISPKILAQMQIVDEMAKKPVCEDSVCIGDVRHVDVFFDRKFC